MKLLSRIAAPLAALSIAATAFTAPVALASEVTPAQIAGDAQLSTIKEMSQAEMDASDRKWIQRTKDNPRIQKLNVFSPSMGRDIPVAVITAKDGSQGAPTIYLLNGAGGAEQNMDWITSGKAAEFYEDKNVNVVIPMQGAFTYYLDWHDPNAGTKYVSGPQKWETFLTKELPGPIESRLGSNNKRGIGGFSMSATSSLLLPQKVPGFYDVAGSFSGCAATSTFLPYQYGKVTVNRGGVEPETVWGPMGGAYNRENDALVNAEKLRGTELYISNASGFAGEKDLPGYYIEQGADPAIASAGSLTLIAEGGVIEAATNQCTHDLKAKLDRAGIPADYNLRATGTHSWNYWIEDMEQSWPTYARALGV
ncbi:esterase family protein [Corynebacterium testudinoris]|uniref:Putative esterase n=1 Tax=Corynebacterium testudinoris TaxID=136857 RepID=A0A0G3H9D9_9CORY|nr:alpha/beta hydrolase family protein [Corynebacterium testudinoris]AKK07747.1 putative esterase [Corynebacterium testudinoris]MBX8995856.1 esterase family protein [Corynebacterium testudinoris]